MRHHFINSAAVAGIIAVVTLSVFAIKGVAPFGDRTLAWGDMTQQGIPFLYGTWDLLHGISSASFEWHILGGVPSWNLPALLTPFNLPLLLVERDNILQFVSLLILFKMICMGLSMYVFANRFDIPRQYKILAGVLYAFGSCVLIHYQIESVMFDSAILFPILMLGFYRLLERGEPALYIILLTLTFGRSFYVGAMVCTFMFFAGIAHFYSLDNRAEFWSRCRLLTLSTVAALTLCALFWLPSVASMFSSDRLSSGTQGGALETYINAVTKWNLFGGEYLFRHFFWTACFFMCSGLPLAVIRLSWRNLSRYHRLLLAIILPTVLIPGTELLMHGGSHQMWAVRFAFIINFVLIEIFLAAVEHNPSLLDGDRAKNFLPPIVLGAAIIFRSDVLTANYIKLTFASVGIAALWFGVYLAALRSKVRWNIIAAAVAIELATCSFLWFAPNFAKLSATEHQISPDWRTDAFNQYLATASNLSRELDRSNDNPLVRTRNVDNAFNSNYAFITGTHSIGAFYGGVALDTKNFYSALGYGRSHVQRVLDSGGTLFTDALLNVRHAFTLNDALSPEFFDADPSIKTVRWFNHKITLPIGLTVARDVPLDDNSFEFQNNIFGAVTGRNVELITQYSTGVVDGKIRLNVVGRRELYLVGDQQFDENTFDHRRHFSIKINGADFIIPNLTESDNRLYPVEFNDNLIDLGTFDNETVEIELSTDSDYNFDGVHIGGLDIDLLRAECDRLNEKISVEIIEVGKDSIELRQNNFDGGTIFLPIPFDAGWHCSINGIDTPTKKIFGGFVGFDAPKGNNVIRLQFSTPGLGLCLSAVGLLLTIVLLRRKNFAAALERPIGLVFMALAAIFLLAFYIIPLIAFLLPLNR